MYTKRTCKQQKSTHVALAMQEAKHQTLCVSTFFLTIIIIKKVVSPGKPPWNVRKSKKMIRCIQTYKYCGITQTSMQKLKKKNHMATKSRMLIYKDGLQKLFNMA